MEMRGYQLNKLTDVENDKLLEDLTIAIEGKYSDLYKLMDGLELDDKNINMFKRLYNKHLQIKKNNERKIKELNNDIKVLNFIKNQLMYDEELEIYTDLDVEELNLQDINNILDIIIKDRKII